MWRMIGWLATLSCSRRAAGEQGQGLAEYSLILGLVFVVAIASVSGFGSKLVDLLTSVQNL